MTTPSFRSAVPEEGRPCGLVISKVWKERSSQTKGGFLIKFELSDPTTDMPIGQFHTPATSRLAEELLKYLQRNERR